MNHLTEEQLQFYRELLLGLNYGDEPESPINSNFRVLDVMNSTGDTFPPWNSTWVVRSDD